MGCRERRVCEDVPLRRTASAQPAADEEVREDVAEGVEAERRTDAAALGAHPAEDEAGEECGEPVHLEACSDVDEREECGLKGEHAQVEVGAKDAAALSSPRVLTFPTISSSKQAITRRLRLA